MMYEYILFDTELKEKLRSGVIEAATPEAAKAQLMRVQNLPPVPPRPDRPLLHEFENRTAYAAAVEKFKADRDAHSQATFVRNEFIAKNSVMSDAVRDRINDGTVKVYLKEFTEV